MSLEVWGMMGAGAVALVSGLVLVRARFAATSGAGKLLVLGPVFEAVALAMFAAEHFLDAHDLAFLVPQWLPWHLFWTYFFGVALLAAAASFVVWRCVRWSALLLAVFFLLIVVTVDLPGVAKHLHERLFWTLMVRETCFAGGALVLAGSQWMRGKTGGWLIAVGRIIVAATFVIYALEHFLFSRFVPGVPLEKMTPEWMPVPVLISYFVGATLLVAGMGLMMRGLRRVAAAGAGGVLMVLTVFFYGSIFVTEIGSPLVVEGVNYVGDTLLFAATALLAGWSGGDKGGVPG